MWDRLYVVLMIAYNVVYGFKPRVSEGLIVTSARDVPPWPMLPELLGYGLVPRIAQVDWVWWHDVTSGLSLILFIHWNILVIGYSCWASAHRYSVVCTAGKGKEKVHQPWVRRAWNDLYMLGQTGSWSAGYSFGITLWCNQIFVVRRLTFNLLWTVKCNLLARLL